MKAIKPLTYLLIIVPLFLSNVISQEIDDEPDPFDIPMTDSPIQSDEIPMNLEEDFREDTLGDERANQKERIGKIYIKGKATVVDGDTIDVDLDLGQIRFKTQGSDGGHNGIKSVIYHLKSNKFDRLKIGIATSLKMRPSENYVLKPFPKKYNKLAEKTITNASSAIDYYLNNTMVKTMNNFN